MKVSGRLEHEISHFKNPSLRVLTTSFPPTTERPLTPHTPGRKCPRTREDSRMHARRVRQTHASRIFPYTTLNRKVHVFESRFHKTFTRKKHFTKYHPFSRSKQLSHGPRAASCCQDSRMADKGGRAPSHTAPRCKTYEKQTSLKCL